MEVRNEERIKMYEEWKSDLFDIAIEQAKKELKRRNTTTKVVMRALEIYNQLKKGE